MSAGATCCKHSCEWTRQGLCDDRRDCPVGRRAARISHEACPPCFTIARTRILGSREPPALRHRRPDVHPAGISILKPMKLDPSRFRMDYVL